MPERRKRVVRPWLLTLGGLAAAVLLLFALVVGPWLLTRHPQQGLTAEQELKAKNDVRTTLVQALAGLAVAGGLVVTYRTFQHNRLEQDRNYRLRQAEQVNEFYAKAVEQLGHEEAPVRLGALYSLVHLAQANPHQRQTVVDVMCAYLRMPYTAPDGQGPSPSRRDPAQELQVRLTAQRLLGDHLRIPSGVPQDGAQALSPTPEEPFWPCIKLDLTGATLCDLDLSETSIVDANFTRATFVGRTQFIHAAFVGDARFDAAFFGSDVVFDGSIFSGEAWFTCANFDGDAWYEDATFVECFQGDEATISGAAYFSAATFNDLATFWKVTFGGQAWFGGVTFADAVYFNDASFDEGGYFQQARVLGLDSALSRRDPGMYRVWPDGWTVKPDADDPTRGTLVIEEQTSEPPLGV